MFINKLCQKIIFAKIDKFTPIQEQGPPLRAGGMGVARIRKAFFIFYFLGGWLSSENS